MVWASERTVKSAKSPSEILAIDRERIWHVGLRIHFDVRPQSLLPSVSRLLVSGDDAQITAPRPHHSAADSLLTSQDAAASSSLTASLQTMRP